MALYFLRRAFFFGDISPKDHPSTYVQLIYFLYKYYDEYCRETPLIVNTCGWVKGKVKHGMCITLWFYVYDYMSTNFPLCQSYQTIFCSGNLAFQLGNAFHWQMCSISHFCDRSPHWRNLAEWNLPSRNISVETKIFAGMRYLSRAIKQSLTFCGRKNYWQNYLTPIRENCIYLATAP